MFYLHVKLLPVKFMLENCRGKPPISLVKTLLSGFHEMRWVPYYIYWHDCRYQGANVSSQQYCR